MAREAGRPPVQLCLNPRGGTFIGVDFEARNIMAVAVDFSDTPLRNAHTHITVADTPDAIVKKIEQMIDKVLPPGGELPLAIGVGVPGLVDSDKGVAVQYKYISNWKNVPLARRLSKKYRVPVFLENSVRSMALAELWYGQGLGLTDFVCVAARSGIGAGMVLGGQLYCGAFHDAGEFGRWRYFALSKRTAPWFATPDAMTKLGIELQEIASVRAVQRAFQNAIAAGEKTILSGAPAPLAIKDIQQSLRKGDPLATLVIDEVARCLGRGIAQLSLVVDPQKIILTGPLTTLGDGLLAPMKAHIKAILDLTESRMPEIVGSQMGEFSGALGAAALALHEWKPDRARPTRRRPTA
jgi:glucokinase